MDIAEKGVQAGGVFNAMICPGSREVYATIIKGLGPQDKYPC